MEGRIHNDLEIFAYHPHAFGTTPVPLDNGISLEHYGPMKLSDLNKLMAKDKEV
jgi:hypothetical protein